MTNTTRPACCHQARLTALAEARWAALHAGSAADLAGIIDSLIHQAKENKMSKQAFTASNGSSLYLDGFGNLCIDGDVALEKGDLEPVIEFFQYQRDQQLGRVRWPENPDYVIYRDPKLDDADDRCVQVFHEPTTHKQTVWERWAMEPRNTSDAAAHWYFTEGPGKKPERPWEEAQAGEVWRLTVDGKGGNYLVKETSSGTPFFFGQPSSLYAENERITAGRKLLNADGDLANE